jgi:hypothetical protein
MRIQRVTRATTFICRNVLLLRVANKRRAAHWRQGASNKAEIKELICVARKYRISGRIPDHKRCNFPIIQYCIVVAIFIWWKKRNFGKSYSFVWKSCARHLRLSQAVSYKTVLFVPGFCRRLVAASGRRARGPRSRAGNRGKLNVCQRVGKRCGISGSELGSGRGLRGTGAPADDLQAFRACNLEPGPAVGEVFEREGVEYLEETVECIVHEL